MYSYQITSVYLYRTNSQQKFTQVTNQKRINTAPNYKPNADPASNPITPD